MWPFWRTACPPSAMPCSAAPPQCVARPLHGHTRSHNQFCCSTLKSFCVKVLFQHARKHCGQIYEGDEEGAALATPESIGCAGGD